MKSTQMTARKRRWPFCTAMKYAEYMNKKLLKGKEKLLKQIGLEAMSVSLGTSLLLLEIGKISWALKTKIRNAIEQEYIPNL